METPRDANINTEKTVIICQSNVEGIYFFFTFHQKKKQKNMINKNFHNMKAAIN